MFLFFLVLASSAAEAFVVTHELVPPFGPGRHWAVGGNATVLRDRVRLTSYGTASSVGWASAAFGCQHAAWEAEARVDISGDEGVGADGIAMWYTVEPLELAGAGGPLFGMAERFEGVGVVIDTYDNEGTGAFPFAMLVFNDGSRDISLARAHHVAGERHAFELGGCTISARNTGPSHLKLVYGSDRSLALLVRGGTDAHFRECARARLDLPRGGFFGFTAATGGLSDNHDLLGFELGSLDDVVRTNDNETLADAIFDLARHVAELRRGAARDAPRSVDVGANVERIVAALVESVRADLRAQDAKLLDLLRNLQPPATPPPPPPAAPEAPPHTWLEVGTFVLLVLLLTIKIYEIYAENEKRKAKMF